jgi:DNA-binding transcriptional MerR regulator
MELAQSTDHTFSLDELATVADVPRRTVRYYIELGLLEGAEGETRAARYTRRHLETLLQIRRLTAEGLALSRVKQRLAAEAAGEVAEVRGGSVASEGAAAAAWSPAVRESVSEYVVSPSIEVRSHLRLAPGVELVIEPGAAQLSPEQLRRFMREALDALARARQEKPE